MGVRVIGSATPLAAQTEWTIFTTPTSLNGPSSKTLFYAGSPPASVPHWQAEARLFRSQARRRSTPSMRQRLDVPGLYRDALRAMPDTIDGQLPLSVTEVCPLTLEELLAVG
jgi:hypothetical protein